jgi:large subunit ribosomal protein L10
VRKEKQLLLDDMASHLGDKKSFLVTRYKLTAKSADDFRCKVASVGGGFGVIRKRILVKAAANVGVELDVKALEGHVGVVFSAEDPIETTKTVFQFSQENQSAIEVLCGVVEGQFYTGAQVERLSKLPGKDQMRSELLGLFEAPMSQTLSVMEALLTSVIHCLKNKCEQSEQTESAESTEAGEPAEQSQA